MVEVDADDRRRDGLRDVGRVEAAAEADLQHGHVDPGAAEVLERRRCQDLEEGRVRLEPAPAHEPLGRVAHGAHGAAEGGVADRAAVHGDPLVDPHEVR